MKARLWVKLTIAFVFVAVVGVSLVAVLANRATAVGFQRYLLADTDADLLQLRDELAAFYARADSWAEVNAVLRDSSVGPTGSGGGHFLRVVDNTGSVVGVRGGQGRGQNTFVPDTELPISVDGQQVGMLLVMHAGQGSQAGQQYLDTVNSAILLGGLVAILIALLLGLLLAQRLTRPLQQLTAATEAIAEGDLEQRVAVSSGDEIGELGQRFNQMAAALDTAERQRQQLLADVAHDLRTPISIIRSHLEAMLDGVFPPTPDNLALVHEETLRLGRLVSDVRTLSLADAGQLPLERTELNVSALVEQAVAAFAPLADADGIALTAEITPTPLVFADGPRVHQTLANLMANALRYAPQGSGTDPAVAVRVDRVDGAVRVSVTDSGPGLTVAQQTAVFDRFWRSDAARSRERGGSGLGLAIAKGIVEAHGGQIAVASEPGAGATFWFTLPTPHETPAV